MTSDECAKCLTVLRTTYQSFARSMTKHDAESIISTWEVCFKDEPYQLVSMAIYDLIQTKKDFAPDIAAIKERINEMTRAATGEPDEAQLWTMLSKAVSNSGYCYKEEFAKLPPILQKFAGSPRTLFEWSQMEADIFNSVTRGQFNKSIKTLKDREETDRRLLANPKMREVIQAFTGKMQLPPDTGYKALTPEQENTSRNRIAATLEKMERERIAPPKPQQEPEPEEEKKPTFTPKSEAEVAEIKRRMMEQIKNMEKGKRNEQ